MTTPLLLITAVFCIGYLGITLEHTLRIDKAALALLTGILCWVIYICSADTLVSIADLPAHFLAEQAGQTPGAIATAWISEYQILHFLGEIASILFFLLGAMTIVEMIDSYDGFSLITQRIHATSKVKLLWIIGLITFFLSASLDNLTTAILMVSLLRKLVRDPAERLFFAGIVIIAANAGGAWSPIGDVTTTMLWIGHQITTLHIIKTVLLPSLVCIIVPLLWLSWSMRGQTIHIAHQHNPSDKNVTPSQRRAIFLVGIGGLLSVPIFKTLTHLPPFMGMLLALAVLWVVSELMHPDKDKAMHSGLNVVTVLKRIDSPSILFFLGILLAVGALQATGLLRMAATFLDSNIGNTNFIIFLIGLFSAVVDNVPLVAASMGMYDLQTFPTDHPMWAYLAFAAGTGGSCLIIGSAAGVAVMGMERISFFWYLRNISGLALAGYCSGALVYLLTAPLFG
jgi:Na+/H+ antiporter NhaD/arsenite permease-like protein